MICFNAEMAKLNRSGRLHEAILLYRQQHIISEQILHRYRPYQIVLSNTQLGPLNHLNNTFCPVGHILKIIGHNRKVCSHTNDNVTNMCDFCDFPVK